MGERERHDGALPRPRAPAPDRPRYRPREAGYIEARRVLVEVSFEVQYRITEDGAAAFRAYAAAVRAVLTGAGVDDPSGAAAGSTGTPAPPDASALSPAGGSR